MPIFSLLTTQTLIQILIEFYCLSVTDPQSTWVAFYPQTPSFDSYVVSLGHSKYPGNPRHQKALFTQVRAFGPLGGATAALTCKYVNNAFCCGDCLLLPITPVERGGSLLPRKNPEGPKSYIIKSEPYNLTGGVRCTIII